MRFRLEPVSSVKHVEEAAAIAQITALFTQEFSDADYNWDDDLLLSSFVDELREEGNFDDADYYETEMLRGVQAAKERVLSDVRSHLARRIKDLGDHSPFQLDLKGGLLLSRLPLNNIDGVGAAYLWLTLFELSESNHDYLQASKADIETFRDAFDDVFEVISCYALAGRSEQYTWYMGKSRSTAKLLRYLAKVTRRASSGQVKDMGQLDANQEKMNDGGVDGIGLTLRNGVMPKDAELILMQATIQKTNRIIKIFGRDQIERLLSLFIKLPRAATIGALVIPYPESEIDAANCAQRHCIYITREEVYSLIGRYPVEKERMGTRSLHAAMNMYNGRHVNSARFLSVDGDLKIA